MCAKIDYALLAQKYNTPYYILDKNAAKTRIEEIKKRLPENTKLCYAIKSNAFLMSFFKDEDLLFEVCSPGELSICEKQGISPDKIVFSGVVKSLDDIKRAYKLKVHTITLESKTHCEYLLETVKESDKHIQNVILRLTGGNQFGMSEKDLEECITKIQSEPFLKIRGIHFFYRDSEKTQNYYRRNIIH